MSLAGLNSTYFKSNEIYQILKQRSGNFRVQVQWRLPADINLLIFLIFRRNQLQWTFTRRMEASCMRRGTVYTMSYTISRTILYVTFHTDSIVDCYEIEQNIHALCGGSQR